MAEVQIKVKAIQKGYYGHQIRKPGAEFFITDPKHFSKKWMEKVEDRQGKSRKEEE